MALGTIAYQIENRTSSIIYLWKFIIRQFEGFQNSQKRYIRKVQTS